MIPVFANWVKYIIFVVLFATFLELLLPSNSMQRFVRVIMGLFVMLAILNPVIDMIQHHVMPTQMPAISASSSQTSFILDHAKIAAKEREELTFEIYKKELAQQMKVMVVAFDGVADAKVVVDTQQGNHNKLSSIVVYIAPGTPAATKVEKISIGEQAPATGLLDVELQNKIKKRIIEMYQVPKEIIEIQVLHS